MGYQERILHCPPLTRQHELVQVFILDYTYDLDKIYTREEIEKAKTSPSFEREYKLKYLGKVGNVFHTLDIEAAICTQEAYQEIMDWSTDTRLGYVAAR